MLSKSAGFTLIEVMLVVSVTGLLLVIALTGQHQLQAQARFDAAIDKTIQNFEYARNFATSNVNTSGGGKDTTTIIAGVIMEVNNSHYGEGWPLEEITTLYGQPDDSGYVDMNTLAEVPLAGISVCPAGEHPDDIDECQEQFMGIGDDLTVSGNGITTWAQIIYVNSNHGLIVCNRPDSSMLTYTEACAAGPAPIDLTLTDPEGFTAKIEIDPSGHAHRL